MIGALLRKELRQHWLAMVLLSTGIFVGYSLIIAATLAKRQAGSGLEVLRLFLMLMAPLAGVLLGHRLVVLEYQARTQLFLEGLPVARWTMVTVKYALGMTMILLLGALAFAIACALSWRRETLTPRFLEILALRSISVIWFIYSFCFLLGMLGRYRVALYLATFLTLGMLAEHTQLQLTRFGPVSLLDTKFAFESEVVPWSALRTTWFLALAFMGLTGVLSLIREGSVASLLAEKMSHKEKVFIAALLFALVQAEGLLSEKNKRVPFDLADAVAEQRPGVLVKVAASPGEWEDAGNLAAYIATELASAREYLGLKQLPSVFITRRRDLDGHHYERGELDGNEGVQVRANFEAKDWDRARFESWLLREVLIVSSRGRAEQERRQWVLDGFPLLWTHRNQGQSGLVGNRPIALRALYGVEDGLHAQDLQQWLTFREKVGDEIAAAVAWSGLRTLQLREGPEACRSFVKHAIGIRPPKDIRATLGRQVESLDAMLRRDAGVNLNDFFEQWRQTLAAAGVELASELKSLPRLRGRVVLIPLSSESRKLRYQAVIEPAPKGPVHFAFLYHPLSAFNEQIDAKLIQREQNVYSDHAEDELPETQSRGGRLFWTLAMEVPELGCQVISGWHRQEIQ